MYDRFLIAYPGRILDDKNAWIIGWSKELDGIDVRLIDLASKSYLLTEKEFIPPTPSYFKDYCFKKSSQIKMDVSDLTLLEELTKNVLQGMLPLVEDGFINNIEVIDIFLLAASVAHNQSLIKAGLKLDSNNIDNILLPRLKRFANDTIEWTNEAKFNNGNWTDEFKNE